MRIAEQWAGLNRKPSQ